MFPARAATSPTATTVSAQPSNAFGDGVQGPYAHGEDDAVAGQEDGGAAAVDSGDAVRCDLLCQEARHDLDAGLLRHAAQIVGDALGAGAPAVELLQRQHVHQRHLMAVLSEDDGRLGAGEAGADEHDAPPDAGCPGVRVHGEADVFGKAAARIPEPGGCPARRGTLPTATMTASGASARTRSGVASVPRRRSRPGVRAAMRTDQSAYRRTSPLSRVGAGRRQRTAQPGVLFKHHDAVAALGAPAGRLQAGRGRRR